MERIVQVRSFGGQIRLGADVKIRAANLECAAGGILIVGDRVNINDGCFLICREAISIGSDVMIGEYVSIRDNDHAFGGLDRPMREQGFTTKPVSIGNDVWIGRGAVIGKGVSIGSGAVIGANAVVTRDIPPFAIAAGVPARVIRSRV